MYEAESFEKFAAINMLTETEGLLQTIVDILRSRKLLQTKGTVTKSGMQWCMNRMCVEYGY